MTPVGTGLPHLFLGFLGLSLLLLLAAATCRRWKTELFSMARRFGKHEPRGFPVVLYGKHLPRIFCGSDAGWDLGQHSNYTVSGYDPLLP